jgi:hypothetical protein
MFDSLFELIFRGCLVALAAKFYGLDDTITLLLILTLAVYTIRSLFTSGYRILKHCGVSQYLVDLCSGPVLFDYRQAFKKDFTASAVYDGVAHTHSHPAAAAARARANVLIDTFATVIGKIVYSVSMSVGENKASVVGSRPYFTAKDLASPFKWDAINTQHLVKMTDVDYYLRPHQYLCGNLVMMYTFVPETCAGQTIDGAFCTNDDNTVTTIFNGGARYTHQLWNYDSDHLVVDHWWGSSVYLLEQKQLGLDRRVILFNPIRQVYGPLGWLIDGVRLERRILSHSSFAFTRALNSDGKLVYSFSSFGEFTSATVPETEVISCVHRMDMAKDPQMSDVERILRAAEIKDPSFVATVLFTLYKKHKVNFLQSTQIQEQLTKCVIDRLTYQPLFPLILESGKAVLRTLGAPWSTASFAPARSVNSDHACLHGRINVPFNDVAVSPFYYTCLQEYLRFLIPDDQVGKLCPYDYEFMENKLKRPTQRSLLQACKHLFYLDRFVTVKSFQKNEPYAKVSAPRNISTLPMEHNFRYGQFCYALVHAVFKPTHWYIFGRHPREMAAFLHSKAAFSGSILLADITRLDGSTGPIHDELTLGTLRRAFAPSYQDEALRLASAEIGAKGVTSNGLVYNTGSTTLSGSSATTWRNTNINAFTAYCSYRRSLNPQASWLALGFYGGDDSANFDAKQEDFEYTYAKMGLLIKPEVVMPGQPITFLGRIYPDIWTTTSSMADIARQVRKLHTTTSPVHVSRADALRFKAEGIMVTDSHTPFLSSWARAVIRLTNRDTRHYHLLADDASYWIKYDSPFEPCTDYNLCMSIASEALQMSAYEITHWEEKFDNATKLDDLFPTAPVVPEPITIELPVAVAGFIPTVNKPNRHREQLRKQQQTPPKRFSAPSTKTRYDVKNKKCIYGKTSECPYAKAGRCVFLHA